jgi:ankyrin repeat protein
MKRQVIIGRAAALSRAVMFFLLPVLLGAQAAANKPSEKPQVVDMGTYRVSPPPEGKWKVIKEEKWGEVIFTKYREGLLTQLAGQPRGTVVGAGFRSLELGEWRMTEDEAATYILNDYIAREARDLEGPGTVTDTGEVVLKDKKLRFVTLRKFYASPDGDQTADTVIFLHFPAPFRKLHSYFFFTYFFVRPNEGPKLYKHPGLEPVQAVIDSLEIVDSLRNAPAPAGDLVRAAAAGDIEAVRREIGQGGSANSQIPQWTALSAASYYGHREVVDLLLGQGADINKADEESGRTPLHRAIIGEEPEIAAGLIERGADVNLRTKAGASALMFAVAIGHPALISTLVEKGAVVEAKTEDGETALMFAAANGSKEIAQLLKAGGADVNALSNAGWTALKSAVRAKHVEIARWLLENGAGVDLKGDSGWTALMSAVQSENLDLARMMIEAGADVNAKTKTGATSLMLAAEYGLADFVKFLLEKGADVNAKTDKKATALKLAKYKKSADIVAMLKAAGAK